VPCVDTKGAELRRRASAYELQCDRIPAMRPLEKSVFRSFFAFREIEAVYIVQAAIELQFFTF
jgi:hypothetical protein